MKKEKFFTKDKILKLCVTGMFAALICVATLLIQIPAPNTGFLNLGDCFILVACWILGPVYGFAAGGIGSMIADLISYPPYAPGTFVIKGLIAVVASIVAHAFIKKNEKLWLVGHVTGAVAGECVMIAGYFTYDAVFMQLGFAGAWLNMPFNLIQGGLGAVLGVILIQVIAMTGVLKKFNPYAVKQW